MAKNSVSNKPSLRLLCLAALLLGAGAAVLWWPRAASAPSARRTPAPAPRSGVVTTVHDSHQTVASYSKTGDARPLPAAPALAEALSHTSRLPYAERLAVVHKLRAAALTPAEAAFLRAFVADSALPHGLHITQVRALKNDVLNVLCLVPGEESATTATLRALFADETADPGLRDYALQHLATLAERDPALGWSSHWAALEGPDPALAATALIHLSILQRRDELSSAERARVEAAALRLVADPAAKEPARATALQVCGRLKLAEARQLAHELARSDAASMPLRIAAIATLGDLAPADPVTRNFLEQTALGSERRLRLPAVNALARLDSITVMKKTPIALHSGAISEKADGL